MYHLNKNYNVKDTTEIVHFISFIRVLSVTESLEKQIKFVPVHIIKAQEGVGL